MFVHKSSPLDVDDEESNVGYRARSREFMFRRLFSIHSDQSLARRGINFRAGPQSLLKAVTTTIETRFKAVPYVQASLNTKIT
jgi:hypothetical protein